MIGEGFSFIGAHLPHHIKDRVREHCYNESISMSEFVWDAVNEKLTGLGISLEAPAPHTTPLLDTIDEQPTC